MDYNASVEKHSEEDKESLVKILGESKTFRIKGSVTEKQPEDSAKNKLTRGNCVTSQKISLIPKLCVGYGSGRTHKICVEKSSRNYCVFLTLIKPTTEDYYQLFVRGVFMLLTTAGYGVLWRL